MKQINPARANVPEIAQAVYLLVLGRHNGAGQVTLRDGETTTTVSNPAITSGSKVNLTAGPGTWTDIGLRVSAVVPGQFTITHANEASTDRTVFWQIAGG